MNPKHIRHVILLALVSLSGGGPVDAGTLWKGAGWYVYDAGWNDVVAGPFTDMEDCTRNAGLEKPNVLGGSKFVCKLYDAAPNAIAQPGCRLDIPYSEWKVVNSEVEPITLALSPVAGGGFGSDRWSGIDVDLEISKAADAHWSFYVVLSDPQKDQVEVRQIEAPLTATAIDRDSKEVLGEVKISRQIFKTAERARGPANDPRVKALRDYPILVLDVTSLFEGRLQLVHDHKRVDLTISAKADDTHSELVATVGLANRGFDDALEVMKACAAKFNPVIDPERDLFVFP